MIKYQINKVAFTFFSIQGVPPEMTEDISGIKV